MLLVSGSQVAVNGCCLRTGTTARRSCLVFFYPPSVFPQDPHNSQPEPDDSHQGSSRLFRRDTPNNRGRDNGSLENTRCCLLIAQPLSPLKPVAVGHQLVLISPAWAAKSYCFICFCLVAQLENVKKKQCGRTTEGEGGSFLQQINYSEYQVSHFKVRACRSDRTKALRSSGRGPRLSLGMQPSLLG